MTPEEVAACAAQSQPNYGCAADALMSVDMTVYGINLPGLSGGVTGVATSGIAPGGSPVTPTRPSLLDVASHSTNTYNTGGAINMHADNQATYLGNTACLTSSALLVQHARIDNGGGTSASTDYSPNGPCGRIYFLWTSAYTHAYTGSPPPPG
jgi:hypothetical protein